MRVAHLSRDKAVGMSADEFQRIVLRLSNSTYVRHWMWFNHPQTPQVMALRINDESLTGRALETLDAELRERGFSLGGLGWYTIPRKDGTVVTPDSQAGR